MKFLKTTQVKDLGSLFFLSEYRACSVRCFVKVSYTKSELGL